MAPSLHTAAQLPSPRQPQRHSSIPSGCSASACLQSPVSTSRGIFLRASSPPEQPTAAAYFPAFCAIVSRPFRVSLNIFIWVQILLDNHTINKHKTQGVSRKNFVNFVVPFQEERPGCRTGSRGAGCVRFWRCFRRKAPLWSRERPCRSCRRGRFPCGTRACRRGGRPDRR